jgi:hypothetical protein
MNISHLVMLVFTPLLLFAHLASLFIARFARLIRSVYPFNDLAIIQVFAQIKKILEV